MINEEIITALDIGTSKIFGISCILRESGPEAIATNLMNFSEDIVKKGRVADIDEVSNCIYDVLKALRTESGETISNVNIGIGGGHLNGILFPKNIDIEPKGREISETDIQMLKREIQNSISALHGIDRQILYSEPQDYIIDNVNLIKKSPVGMHGNFLQMKVHVLTAEVNPVRDIKDCVKKAGAQVEGIFAHSWAVAEATLSEEEKKLGCLLLDMGKGTTDIVFFSDNSILITDSLKIGGENIDIDISKVLHTPVLYAEELKKKHAWANYPVLLREKSPVLSETVDIFDLSGKIATTVTVENISHIVYARILESMEDYIKGKMEKISLMHSCSSGIIISGGLAKLKGINQLAESVFGLPVRTGIPRGVLNLDKSFQSPEFASAIGTVMLASKREKKKRKKGIRQKIDEIMRIPKSWF